ncbi:MAG: hypothetical protein ABSD98_04230 [Candidatus Korobacteraceae bacterium]|jgi:hypothetical protein
MNEGEQYVIGGKTLSEHGRARRELAAEKYRPNKTCILFVAEAPPDSVDRYFYYEHVKCEDWLWIALMKALYPSKWGRTTERERQRKAWWLLEFQKSGFLLIDAVKEPICGGNRKRVKLIDSAAHDLIAEIQKIKPKQIVLIKATVYKALFDKLRDGGFPVVNEKSLPFPSSGRQSEFAVEFRRLVDTGRLLLCST